MRSSGFRPCLSLVAPVLSLVVCSWLCSPIASAENGYIGCSYSDDAYPFDLTTLTVGASIDLLPEGNYPYDATISPDGSEVWIPGASGDGIVVIDRAGATVTARIPADEYMIGVAFTDDGAYALGSSRDSDTVSRIDAQTHTVLDAVAIPFHPGNLALDPVSGKIFGVEWYGTDLFVISPDGSTLETTAAVGNDLWQIVVAPDGSVLYVTDRGSDLVRVVDPVTLAQVHSVAVGDDPWGIDVTSDGGKLVVVCEDSHNAYVIDTATWDVTPVALAADADPRDVDILDSKGVAFAAGGQAGGGSPIYIIDIEGAVLLDQFDATGSNTNVIAVQAQMSSATAAVPSDDLVSIAPRPARLELGGNPFTSEGRVFMRLDSAQDARVAVHSIDGRHIATLHSGFRQAGSHALVWDGRDQRGTLVPSGTYLVTLRTAVGGDVKQVLLVR